MLFKALQNKLLHSFATKLQAASTKNKKDSAGKRLGVKILGSQATYPNDILIRQRGLKWKPGLNTLHGRDQTIHSKIEGVVKYTKEYEGRRKITTVHVLPKYGENKKQRPPLPFCYHPELYPELAVNNPEPVSRFTKWDPVKVEKEKRKDYPYKIGTTKTMFSISLPDNFIEKKEIEARKGKFENLDPFEEYSNEVDRRYSIINEKLKTYE